MKLPAPEELQRDPFGSHEKLTRLFADYETLKRDKENMVSLIRGIVREEIHGIAPGGSHELAGIGITRSDTGR